MAEPYVRIGADGIPQFIRVPTTDELKALKPSDPEDMAILWQYRKEIGFLNPSDIRRSQIKYLERFNITPDNPRYQEQLAALNEGVNSNKVLLAQARRSTEQAQTDAALQGNPEQNFIYVNEGPDPCEECVPLNGEEGTYAYFVANNIRPGDQCLGGSLCLCILVPVDSD